MAILIMDSFINKRFSIKMNLICKLNATMFIGVVFALFFNLSSIYAVNKPIEDKYLEYKQNVSPNHYKLIETQYSQLKRDQQQEIKKDCFSTSRIMFVQE